MIIVTTPQVKIKGRPAHGDLPYENGVTTYTMRRLSTRDTFKLIGILEVGSRASGTDLRKLDLGSLDDPTALVKNLGQLLFNAMAYADDDVVTLFASLLGVKPELFADGDVFPMGSEVLIIQGLVKHPDATALIEQLGNVLSGMNQTTPAPASPEVSTDSAPGTAG